MGIVVVRWDEELIAVAKVWQMPRVARGRKAGADRAGPVGAQGYIADLKPIEDDFEEDLEMDPVNYAADEEEEEEECHTPKPSLVRISI
ncbi:hypothetical protein Tco_0855300 [Tanacetum coccineum]